MLIEIANKGRYVYLFYRINGKKVIKIDSNFYPYYYELEPNGKYKSLYGDKLRKIIVSSPDTVSKVRGKTSFESDILYVNRYYVDKIKSIEKTNLKIGFIDIEVKSKDFPNPKKADFPISSISVHNFNKETVNFFIGDLAEKELLSKLVEYLKKENFDLLLGWNIAFDWEYLNNRWHNLFRSRFSPKISMIGSSSFKNKLFVPDGTVILDYLEMYKKIFPHGRKSYTLDYILEYEFGEGKSHPIKDFNIVNEDLRYHNIEDVEDMGRIENKHHLIDFYDEIRRTAICSWYDVLMNSRMIDVLLLRKAKSLNIVLPNKKEHKEESFKGAYRKSNVGFYEGMIYNADLVSAYPSCIVTFNLSPENVGKEGIQVNGVSFRQTSGILTIVTKELGAKKAEIKELKKKNKAYSSKYQAIKGIYNSLFGYTGYKGARIYSMEVAKTITYLVRELLHYIENHIAFKTVFIDTDGIAYQAERDLVDDFNALARKWAKEKYNKDIDIIFESDEVYTKMLNLANCHYIALNERGEYKVRGLEMKRSSSSAYQSWFQETLIKEHIFKDEDFTTVRKWVESEKERIKTLSLLEIAFPAKIKEEDAYKTTVTRGDGKVFNRQLPIFYRALQNSSIKKRRGELFYWLYITTGSKITAIDDNHLIDKRRVDWNKMIERNIDNIWSKIKEAMGWSTQRFLF